MADNNMPEGECILNITEETVMYYVYSQEDTFIITIIIPIILSLGIINNSAFLFVIFRVPTMRSATNIYLMHLALADLLYLIVNSNVFYILKYVASRSTYNDLLKSHLGCFIFEFLKNTGYFASIALVTIVSFERYLAVCHPIKHLKIRGRRRTNTMVSICWVVGLIFACSTTLGTAAFSDEVCAMWPEGYENLPTQISFCAPLSLDIVIVPLILTTLPWFIAMIANIVMYVRIIYALNKRRSATFMKGKKHKAQQSRNKVAKLLIINGVVFFTCQTPAIVVSLYHANLIDPDLGFYYDLKLARSWVSNLPLLINTIVNPLIYGAIHAQYRSAFIQAFRCNTGIQSTSIRQQYSCS